MSFNVIMYRNPKLMYQEKKATVEDWLLLKFLTEKVRKYLLLV